MAPNYNTMPSSRFVGIAAMETYILKNLIKNVECDHEKTD